MQLADFEALKVDLVQQEQQEEEHEEQQLTNLTNLVQTKNSVEPAVQPDFWTTGQPRHSVLIPDQSLQSNVVMVILLAISILIYFSMRRPALS